VTYALFAELNMWQPQVDIILQTVTIYINQQHSLKYTLSLELHSTCHYNYREFFL